MIMPNIHAGILFCWKSTARNEKTQNKIMTNTCVFYHEFVIVPCQWMCPRQCRCIQCWCHYWCLWWCQCCDPSWRECYPWQCGASAKIQHVVLCWLLSWMKSLYWASYKITCRLNLLLIPRKSLSISYVRAHQEEFTLFYLVAVSFSHKTCSEIFFPAWVKNLWTNNNPRRCFSLSLFSCTFESELTVQTNRYSALFFCKRNITL